MFIANVGGLLSLFMGFSVFSIIEIIYFITLRPYCALKKRMASRNDANVVNIGKPRKSWQMEIGLGANMKVSSYPKKQHLDESKISYLE